MANATPYRKNTSPKTHIQSLWGDPWHAFYKICLATNEGPVLVALPDLNGLPVQEDRSPVKINLDKAETFFGETDSVYIDPPVTMLDQARVLAVEPDNIPQVWRMGLRDFSALVKEKSGRALTNDEKAEVIIAIDKYNTDGEYKGIYPNHDWWKIAKRPSQALN